LDKGESVAALIKDPVPGEPVPPILTFNDGFLILDSEKFPASFAADVEPEKAAFMADSQVPWGSRRAERHDQRSRFEERAKLVSGKHRRQNDSTARSTFYGGACRFEDR
jgi:hypothetical protein